MKIIQHNRFIKFIQEINKEIQALTAESKITRRRGLEKLIRCIFDVKNPYSSEVLKVVFPNLCKQTLKLYADPTDRTRELAVTLVTKYELFVPFVL